MPAILSHCLMAKEVYEQISGKEGLPILDKRAFYWGAQGGDVFFFHRVLPWQRGKSLRKYGSLLHKQEVDSVFEAMREYVVYKSHRKALALSYVCGYFCHYALDRAAHPYVYAAIQILKENEKLTQDILVHFRIESALDVYLLKEKTGKHSNEIKLYELLSGDSVVGDEIASLLAYVFKKVFGMPDQKERMRRALLDMRLCYRFINDNHYIKRNAIRFFELLFGPKHALSDLMLGKEPDTRFDYTNRERAVWQSPFRPYVNRYESFDDLYAQAVREGKSMILAFRRSFHTMSSMFDITGNRSFDTGECINNG